MSLTALERAKFRVKLRSLAAEAKIIRHEENRFKRRYRKTCNKAKPGWMNLASRLSLARVGLHDHRVRDLRFEMRATLLAYALVRGLPYTVAERDCKKPIHTGRVIGIIKSLTGFTFLQEQVAEWIRGGCTLGCRAAS